MGFEQGLQKQLASRINHYADQYEFDFIIGSSHLVNGTDPYYESYWDGISIKEGIEKYYNSILENIRTCDKFDVYGHIDYIIRYIPDKSFTYQYTEYAEVIDEILSLLIRKGKGIELNTSGLKYGLNQVHPCTDAIKRYRELGGEIITIGSDAHCPEHLAYDFDKIPAILESCGFHYYTIFKKRKPEFIPLI
jgi:histidinol-phosphatase (PHP family)